MVSALATHYGDEALATMLAAAKQSTSSTTSSRATATRLENVQLKTWMADGKNVDDVFKLLKLDEAGSNLLKSPTLSTWMAYTSKLKKDPYDLLLFKLKPRYEDDAGLAKMLVLSKNDPTTKAIAELLETVQLDNWVKQKKNMIDVFRLLKLNEEGTTLLKSPVLSTWVSYVEKLQKNPYKLLFSAIKTTGFDDVVLAKMIGLAKQDVNTGSIAGKMEQLQSKKWTLAGKSGDDLFQLVGLRKEGDKVFESPVWDTWVSYPNKREADPDKVLFSVLRNRFGDERLTSMVARAEDVKSTKDVASKLEPDVWYMNGQTSEEVFNLLKLNTKGDKIFESPALSTWVAYVNKLSKYKQHPDSYMAVTQLKKRYGDVNLARMLAQAKQRANTEATKDVIVDLQKRLQSKKWVIQRNDPKTVSEKLGKGFLLHKLDNERVKRDFQAFYMFNAY